MPTHARRSWARFPAALALAGLASWPLASTPASAQAGRAPGPFPVQHSPAQVHVIRTAVDVLGGSFDASGEITSIPAGKRFVVELITASAKVPAGQEILLFLTTNPTGTDHLIFIPLLIQTTIGASVSHAYLPGRFYVDASSPALHVLASRTDTTSLGQVVVTLSGYLVDLPAP